MSNKKNSELKNRMSALKVGEPFRLPKIGPTFTSPSARAPEVPAPQNGVPSFELAQRELAQIDRTTNKATRIEAAHIELSQFENASRLETVTGSGNSIESQIEGPPREVPRFEVPRSEGTADQNAFEDFPQIESAQNERTRKEPPQSESAPNEVARSKPTQNELPQNKVTYSEAPQNNSPHNELSPTERARTEAARNEGPRIKLSRNEAPQPEPNYGQSPPLVLAPQSEDAHFEGAHFEQPRSASKDSFRSDKTAPSGSGFFRLSPRAFTQSVLQELPGDSFRLFLWLSSRAWRFVKSDGTVRASVSYIEQDTGMGHATISRGLKTLREKKLISLLDTDYKRGNVWRISPIAFAGRNPDDAPPPFEPPRKEDSQNETPAPSKRDPLSLKMRDEVPHFEAEIRSIKNSKNLSQECEMLFSKIEQIGAPDKRKSERAALERLLELKSPSEIRKAIAYIERKGALVTSQKCHSPFQYLATAIDDVLAVVVKNTPAPVNHVIEMDSLGAEAEANKKLLDEQAKKAALAAFESELTAYEREEMIEEVIKSQYTFGYRPSHDFITSLVAVRWFVQRNVKTMAG